MSVRSVEDHVLRAFAIIRTEKCEMPSITRTQCNTVALNPGDGRYQSIYIQWVSKPTNVLYTTVLLWQQAC